MRILLVCNIFPPEFIGGYELGAFDVAAALASLGHEVLVATSPVMGFAAGEEPSFQVRRSLQTVAITTEYILRDDRDLRGPFLHFGNLRAIHDIVEAFKPERVVCFNLAGLGALAILKYLNATGQRSLLYLMDNVFGTARDIPSRINSFNAMFSMDEVFDELSVIAMSGKVLGEVHAELGRELPKHIFVPGWTDIEGPSTPVLPSIAGGEPTRFVFASRIAPHKGIDIVLDATKILVDAGLSNFNVTLFGAGQVARAMQRVYGLGIESHVSYAGCPPKPELLRAYADFDALLLPTWEREPFGFVVSEAAVQGCIPVMTSVIGAAEWMVDGHGCIKVPRSAGAFAGAMADIIQMSPERRHRARDAARATGRAMFDFARWLPKIVRAVEEVPAPAGTGRADGQAALAAMIAIGHLWRRANG